MSEPRTLFDKIWASHLVETQEESAEAEEEAEEESAEDDSESTEDSAGDDDAAAETEPQEEGEADVRDTIYLAIDGRGSAGRKAQVVKHGFLGGWLFLFIPCCYR